MKKLFLLVTMLFTITVTQAQIEEPTLYGAVAQDAVMSIDGPHGNGGVLNPEFTLGVDTSTHLIWVAYEYLSVIDYQKLSFGVEQKVPITNKLESSYGIEISNITRKDNFEDGKHTGKYTGPDTSWSLGVNLTLGYYLTDNLVIFANSNAFTPEKYDNYGNEMKKLRIDGRLGIRIYLCKIP